MGESIPRLSHSLSARMLSRRRASNVAGVSEHITITPHFGVAIPCV